jgi:hypothetical protein
VVNAFDFLVEYQESCRIEPQHIDL